MNQQDIARLERLVAASDVFDVLASEYDRRGTYPSWEVCQRVALDTLLARLRNGVLDAWATSCQIDSSHDTGPISAECIVSPYDYFRGETPCMIPVEFWYHFHAAGPDGRSVDWVAGDFLFDYFDAEYSKRDGSAFSVYFDPKGLPPIAIPPQLPAAASDYTAPQANEALSPSKFGGRKPANWWPDFAVELAMYCLKEELPEGSGAEGQSEMIKAIFDRMANRGKAEPSRTTVQPVINEILRRFRSAGN